MIKYFHELTNEEYKVLEDNGTRWCDLPSLYPQPEWCNYPDALDGEMGCWSLVYRTGVSKEYCKNCECFKNL
jgi:hypothetical protein